MAGIEDNSMVGRTFAHPKADAAATPARSPKASVAGRMFLAIICGAFFGALLSIILAPDLLLAFAVGGAMSFGAGTVAIFMFKLDQPDEYSQGKSRTEEEVRQALADIERQEK
ncbi:MAG: hypothetical protein ABJF86_14790 [Tateyamaria sp.]|uniref:hypothetical protein n=1 Tax=Tateyamaria sp. TaxID=1929288 RepID=UPI0032845B03